MRQVYPVYRAKYRTFSDQPQREALVVAQSEHLVHSTLERVLKETEGDKIALKVDSLEKTDYIFHEEGVLVK